MFSSERALARYLADEHDHDLSDLSTYDDIRTAATDGSLAVDITDDNIYVLSGLADDFADGPDAVDRDQLDLAVELLRDIGDYSEESTVDKALETGRPLGKLVALRAGARLGRQARGAVFRGGARVGEAGTIRGLAAEARIARRPAAFDGPPRLLFTGGSVRRSQRAARREGEPSVASRHRPPTAVRIPTSGHAAVRSDPAGAARRLRRRPGSAPTAAAPVHRGRGAAVVVAAPSDRGVAALPGPADRRAGHPHARHAHPAQPRRHHAGDRHVELHAGHRCRAQPAQGGRAGGQPVRQSADAGHQSRTGRIRGNAVPAGAADPAAPGDPRRAEEARVRRRHRDR